MMQIEKWAYLTMKIGATSDGAAGRRARRGWGMPTARLAIKHIKGCRALEYERKGVWRTCWGPMAWGAYGEPIIKTERKYGKVGRRIYTWLVFMCNCMDCPARLHVNVDAIALWANSEAK